MVFELDIFIVLAGFDLVAFSWSEGERPWRPCDGLSFTSVFISHFGDPFSMVGGVGSLLWLQ
jgi:hypothetical protein